MLERPRISPGRPMMWLGRVEVTKQRSTADSFTLLSLQRRWKDSHGLKTKRSAGLYSPPRRDFLMSDKTRHGPVPSVPVVSTSRCQPSFCSIRVFIFCYRCCVGEPGQVEEAI